MTKILPVSFKISHVEIVLFQFALFINFFYLKEEKATTKNYGILYFFNPALSI